MHAPLNSLPLLLCLALPAQAALQSGVYCTSPGATVHEFGDRVPDGSRVVPISATVTLDLASSPPSLTAFIPNAVLEGGDPFALTVDSSFGSQSEDGSYRFSGDYLGELSPSGSQYGFDWSFSTCTNGNILWNGVTAWLGGHIWIVTISNLTLVAQATLSIRALENESAEISWSTNFGDYVLEWAETLPPGGWMPVPDPPNAVGDHFSVTIPTTGAPRFYRLRRS